MRTPVLDSRSEHRLDRVKGLPNGIPMPTIATKVPDDLAEKVRRAAKSQKITVSAYIRKAVENEVAGGKADTLGVRFAHLCGVAKRMPADASRKEGYED